MAASMVSLRLPGELLEWATVYAKARGVSRTDLLVEAVRSFKDGCDGGVPEIRRRPPSYVGDEEAGVGDCPSRGDGLGHVWRSWQEDAAKPCRFCGLSGRVYFGEVSAERRDVFARLVVGMQSGTGDPKKAHPDGLSPEQEARVAAIVADKKRRDAEARASGVGRPGQLGRKASS